MSRWLPPAGGGYSGRPSREKPPKGANGHPNPTTGPNGRASAPVPPRGSSGVSRAQ